MGNYVPVDQVRDDIASAYEKEVECEAQNMLLMYKNMCDGKVCGYYSRQHFLYFMKFHILKYTLKLNKNSETNKVTRMGK